MKRAFVFLVCAALVAGACSSTTEDTTTTTASESTPTTTAPSTTTMATTTTTPEPVPAPPSGFDATLEEVPLLSEGSYAGPAWPASLDGVAFLEAVPVELQAALLRDGFAIEANTDVYDNVDQLGWSSQFSSTYLQLSPYGENRPVFVTTDAALHLWHLVFDKILRDTEEDELLPVLEEMVGTLVARAREQSASAPPDIADAATRAQEHLEAVATVLGLDVGPIGDRAAEEVALVEAHTEFTVSPTVGGSCELPVPTASCVDYSLMTPRGHYTRTEDLTRFFKAMSMLGNTGFSVQDVETLRVGLLIARLIVTDAAIAEQWSTIYGPTTFLVGTADDYTPFEAADVADEVVSGGLADPEALDDATVEAIGAELLASREVLIDPGRASLRTMGARFVLDSYFYDRFFTDPGLADRVRPSPLDLAASFGNERAYDIQLEAGVADMYPEYPDRVAELTDLVANRTMADWGRTVYDGWLYALQAIWADKDLDVFPPVMRNEAWQTKTLNGGLGSYTELKHDTILYAKQGIAEGEGPEPQPLPRHWVEPDPVTFGRVAAVARMMRDGLVAGGLMIGDDAYDPEFAWDDESSMRRFTLEFLIEMLDRFAAIAADELAGSPISSEDNEWLAFIGERFETIVDLTGYEYGFDPAPLVADIFLDPFADEVLEVATGPHELIYALVPNDEGAFQVATGAVYAYYEFWGPREDRMTDEEWWDLIVAGDLPERPAWWTDTFGG